MTAHERISRILHALEETGEDLLALSDDIWDNIDHNDTEAMQQGVAFKAEFNEELAEFQKLSDRIRNLVSHQEGVSFEGDGEEIAAGHEEPVGGEEPDLSQAHRLSEDFTFRKPTALTIGDAAVRNIPTWRRLYETACRLLRERDPEAFESLPDRPEAKTRHGNRIFSRGPGDLRVASKVGDTVYAEVHCSANGLCGNLCQILGVLGIPENEVSVFLRDDDSGEERSDLEEFVERFKNLHPNTAGGHESPHQPVMLLAVMDGIEHGEIAENRILFDDSLRNRFSELFEPVANEGDVCNSHLPFFHLRSSRFWDPVPREGSEAELGGLKTVSGPGQVEKLIDHVRLDGRLFELMRNPNTAAELRATLIHRYLPALEKTLPLAPAAFRKKCLSRLEDHFGSGLRKAFRNTVYETADGDTGVLVSISRRYWEPSQADFWYTIRGVQLEHLGRHPLQFLALGCGAPDTTLLIPMDAAAEWLDEMVVADDDGNVRWDIKIDTTDDGLVLRRPGKESVPLNEFLK